jgi:hypothetical protein
MPNSGITTGTPAKIPFGAGVYFQGITYDEKVAPTAEQIKAAIIGATQEGGTLTITPEFFAPELDGATVAVKELQNKVGETAQMETSFAELTADLMARMAIGKIGATTDSKYDVITSSEIRAGHFYDGFGYYGKFLDGRPLIIMFKHALCTSGFTTDAKNKTNSVFKGTFACMSDIEYSTTKLPYAIFIHKPEGWTAVTPEELTAA